MSNKDVNLAAGTLYGAIENLKKHGYIKLVSPLGERKKVYHITDDGKEVLKLENDRLKKIVQIYESESSVKNE